MEHAFLTFDRLKNGRPDDGWLPTSENINNLPVGIKNFIHDIQTLCDPAGMVIENALLRDQLKECHDYIVLLKRTMNQL